MASSYSLHNSLLYKTNLQMINQLPKPIIHLFSISTNLAKFKRFNLRAVTASCLVSNKSSAPSNPFEEEEEDPLKIGIIGFGNLGRYIGGGIKRQGHIVLATSGFDCSEYCDQNGIRFLKSMEELCREEPDIVLICSSILSTEKVVRDIPTHKLRPDTIFADALPVKQFPRSLFLEVLPPELGIVCTHPLFRPESGNEGWDGLPFVYDRVRVSHGGLQDRNCARFLQIFQQEGCRMVKMSCEEYDHHAAFSQFIPHTIGRVLSQLDLESTSINTKGYETLLKLTENTVHDSCEFYHGLFMYNANATQQIENLDRAFEKLKQKLYGRLREIDAEAPWEALQKQLVERIPMEGSH